MTLRLPFLFERNVFLTCLASFFERCEVGGRGGRGSWKEGGHGKPVAKK